MMFSLEILESVLLLILLIDILRSGFLVNQYLLIALAIFTVGFLVLSLLKTLKLGSFWAVRFLSVLLIIIILYGFWMGQNIVKKNQSSIVNIHDGVILTDAATNAIISGKNPYAISYKDEFANLAYKPSAFTYNHFMYSPLTFLINVPQALIFGPLGISDFRITLTVFLFFAAVLGVLIVKEKILFLIIFAFNPLFIPLTFYGANEVMILFFLMAALALLKNNRINLATVMVALATGTKLLILPFVPLYFMYILIKTGNKQVVKQLLTFGLVTLVIYLPFIIWGPGDLMEDVVFYHLAGGQELHIIAGFVGIPQMLVNWGLMDSTSKFPFYIFQAIIGILALLPAWYILKKFASPAVLCLTFLFYFLAIFAFSRIMQISYLAYLSQIMLLAAFLINQHRKKSY